MDPDPDEHVHPGQEDLVWGSGIKDKERKVMHKYGCPRNGMQMPCGCKCGPKARYNKVSEKARTVLSGDAQCSMFCGGAKCKYCTTSSWKPEQMVIKGLYSEWVTDNILAMARPSNYGFDNYQILDQFVENNICTVINLQERGEHASCGYGNDSSGFSYNPQHLMEKKIFFYNFSWPDYSTAAMSKLLDVAKVMQFSLAQGKVAVHCHAGLGRTGLLIACYLVFNNRLSAADAVNYVRSRRPGSIQTSQQVQSVFDFEKHLKPFRTVFPKMQGKSEVTFKHFLNRQCHMIHGFEERRLKHIPKVVYICCERLLELGGRSKSLTRLRCSTATSLSIPTSFSGCLNSKTTDFLTTGRLRSSCSQTSLAVPTAGPTGTLLTSRSLEDLQNESFKHVLADRKDDDSSSTSTDMTRYEFADSDGGKGESRLSKVNGVEKRNMDGKRNDNDDGQSSAVLEKPKFCMCGVVDNTKVAEREHGSDADSSHCNRRLKKRGLGERLKGRRRDNVGDKEQDRENLAVSLGSKGSQLTPFGEVNQEILEKVCEAMALTEYCAEVRNQADEMEGNKNILYLVDLTVRAFCACLDNEQKLLNETDKAWVELSSVEDPEVLSAIFWDWLDQLKEPVLKRQDLIIIMEKMDSPKECMEHLEKSVKHFLEYLARVVAKLFPQPEALEVRVMERLLSHLTHMTVTLDDRPTPAWQPVSEHWGVMKASEAQRLIKFFLNLVDEIGSVGESKWSTISSS